MRIHSSVLLALQCHALQGGLCEILAKETSDDLCSGTVALFHVAF